MVTNELRGERVDVVPFSDDPVELIQNALAPARVREVRLDDETGTATVVVSDYQLSLAIGKEGQNARLAARLTGWRIDIKSETQLAEEEAGYGGQEWAEGEWVENEAGEMVWKPAEGGDAISAEEWSHAAEEQSDGTGRRRPPATAEAGDRGRGRGRGEPPAECRSGAAPVAGRGDPADRGRATHNPVPDLRRLPADGAGRRAGAGGRRRRRRAGPGSGVCPGGGPGCARARTRCLDQAVRRRAFDRALPPGGRTRPPPAGLRRALSGRAGEAPEAAGPWEDGPAVMCEDRGSRRPCVAPGHAKDTEDELAKKIRVYELARELGLTNKEALDLCIALGHRGEEPLVVDRGRPGRPGPPQGRRRGPAPRRSARGARPAKKAAGRLEGPAPTAADRAGAPAPPSG